MKKLMLLLTLLKAFCLSAQPAGPVPIEYQGVTYWKYESVDSMNNTPYKLYFMYDLGGRYLGWEHEFPRDGKWISFFIEDSSKVASIFEVKNKLLNGKEMVYHFDETKQFEFNFFDGEKYGFVRGWNTAGILVFEEEYAIINDEGSPSSVRVGEWRHWDDEGRLRRVEHYVDDQEDGAQLEYYDNGETAVAAFYKDGLRDSLLTTYHPNGQIKTQVAYKNGDFVTNNPNREFHPNGKVSGMGNWEDGRKIGPWTYFYENGKKESQGEYGTYIYHHDHGDFNFCVKTGLWKYWYPTGTFKAKGSYDAQDVEDYGFDAEPYIARAPRKSDWKYYNKKGMEISRSEFEAEEQINDY
jgi:antitoxin component YwqK of YwqJK toxin-antitoxin module